MAGLTADARSLNKFMRSECLNHRFVFGSQMPVGRLMGMVAEKHQECTQSYVRRPYGVGLLVAGVDKTGPHLYQTCPSGNVYEYKAHAIGARSQSARTYLEKHYDTFAGLDRDTLILHALRALSTCTEASEELTADSASIGIVGRTEPFRVIEGAAIAPALESLRSFHPVAPAGAAAAAAAAAGAAEAAADGGAATAEDEDGDMAMA